MNIGLLIVAVGLAVASVPFFLGFGASLIAGFNTATEEEKARVNKIRLCRTIGCFLLCMAVLVFLWFLYGDGFYPVFLVLAGIAVAGCIVFANLGCKNKKP